MRDNKTIQGEITWVALLRIVACLLVVIAHCCDPFVSGSSVEGFNAGAFWGTLCRASVPLFIMISGVLLLPTKLRIGEFYSRRLKRILIPFIFWSLVSPWLFYLLTQSVDTVNPTLIDENHTLLATIEASYLWLFNFSYSTIPYWYIYMMIGVYLIIPTISEWVAKATKRELLIVLGIWLFTTTSAYIQAALPLIGYRGNYGSMGIYGECSWNLFTTFHYMGGFLGYVLLAHFLVRYPLNWSMAKTLSIGSLLFVLGFLITLYGFHFTRDNYPDNFNMLEVIWSFTNINVVMMTAALFIIFQKIEIKPRAWISRLSAATYGIFLVHFIVVHSIFELIYQNFEFSPMLQIPTVAIISFTLTWAVVILLRSIAIFRKLT